MFKKISLKSLILINLFILIIIGISDGQLIKSFKETKVWSLEKGEKIIRGEMSKTGNWFLITKNYRKKSVIINGKREGWFDEIHHFTFSPNGNRYVYVLGSNGKWTEDNVYCEGKYYLVLDGKKSNAYDYVDINLLRFSSDNKRFAYVYGIGGRWKYNRYFGGKYYVVIDGKKSEAYDLIRDFSFSPNSKRYAYIASIGGKWVKDLYCYRYIEGKWFLIVDGKKYGPFKYIRYFLFSPDSKRIAYIACTEGIWTKDELSAGYYYFKTYKEFVGLEEKKEEIFSFIWDFQFSPDGKKYTYFANVGGILGIGGKYYLVIDGKKSKVYDDILFLQFSPDSKRIAYCIGEDILKNISCFATDKYYLVIDGKKGEPFNYIENFQFSPNGKRYAYIGRIGGEWAPLEGLRGEYCDGKCYVVIDNKKYGAYEFIGNIIFSPNDERYAYLVRNKEKAYVVVDGKQSEIFDDVFDVSLQFSPDSENYAFIAKNENKCYMIINGKRSEAYDNIEVFSFKFSSDSKNYLYIGEIDDKYYFVFNDKRSEPFDYIYSDDVQFISNNNYMYIGEIENEIYIIVNESKSKPYKTIYNYYLDDKGNIIAFAERDNGIFIVEYK